MRVADALVMRLAHAGARAIFGMPGGGSNLDVIQAAHGLGLPFVLAHTETAAAIMAAAQAEITGAPGVCLSTLGPGVSSIVNGVAHAWLDRVPLVVLTDTMVAAARERFEHQNLPHSSLLRPITKFSAELCAERFEPLLSEALARALGDPPGPVHLDCAPDVMSCEIGAEEPLEVVRPESGQGTLCDRTRRLLAAARRPLVIAGLGGRRPADVTALRRLCEDRGLPALVTYKAKGVIPDGHPMYGGLFTLGEIERPIVERADMLITVGLDPVELLPRPWPWTHPLLHCARWPSAKGPLGGGEIVVGDLAGVIEEIREALAGASDWSVEEIAAHRQHQHAAVLVKSGGFTPGQAIAAIAANSHTARHVTVDAGAHMFPAMTLLPADAPGRILISNGLSTMGYALPAAIGAALLGGDHATIAITGDAGLLLCLGELRTLARSRARVAVVVFADGELSLIRIKQDRRRLDPLGVRIGGMEWPGVARALGLRASRAGDSTTLGAQLAEALEADRPSLIEAVVDPTGYGRMLEALRG
jgi:acetolactate synthase I/II/III large subunit